LKGQLMRVLFLIGVVCDILASDLAAALDNLEKFVLIFLDEELAEVFTDHLKEVNSSLTYTERQVGGGRKVHSGVDENTEMGTEHLWRLKEVGEGLENSLDEIFLLDIDRVQDQRD